ncbi:hypothetical protein BIFCAT_01393 [Bifidobacterium catenulatum DSM 16992 = JCM 1194 = LMG 11043]|uniref:Uncharacterized protein n=1 Tax=Bifidobacterium catenulatum DSM 16992 = JCM 1194 = LMG 11043 TaxID=566552 RepID=B6XVX6_9BIFI|nr:hypothetical protein BIFCAT_01393 [Bifidobacterium catenulatum DSM 16992 = JCM 1194 = LMG 11043]
MSSVFRIWIFRDLTELHCAILGWYVSFAQRNVHVALRSYRAYLRY